MCGLGLEVVAVGPFALTPSSRSVFILVSASPLTFPYSVLHGFDAIVPTKIYPQKDRKTARQTR